jgi:hypothetical protein
MNESIKTYPVHIRGELTAPPERGWWLIKWLLGIPHYFILCFLWIGFIFVAIIAFFAILFTGKYPRGLFHYNAGVLRWTWRVAFYSYGALATDKYPPFSLKPDSSYPADLEIPYPEKLSKGLVLVKWWLLAIPQYVILGILVGGWGGQWGTGWGTPWDTATDNVSTSHWALYIDGQIWQGSWQTGNINTHTNYGWPGLICVLAIFAAVYLLFAGRYPNSLFKLVLGFNRWAIRVVAYASLMTDEYPPFRLEE